MALTILFDITRSTDSKSIVVADDGTAWGVGGEPGTVNVTGVTLDIFGVDKVTPQKTVAFTSGEVAGFVAGDNVTLTFLDSRLWGTVYAPDNFYLGKLTVAVNSGTAIATMEAFDSYFYIKKLWIDDVLNVNLPVDDLSQASRTFLGNMVALLGLDVLSSEISVDRENKWRKAYDQLAWNYDI